MIKSPTGGEIQMKRWKKILLGIFGTLALLVLGLIGFIELRWNRKFDQVVGPELHASSDAKVIAHGKYLVRGPAHRVAHPAELRRLQEDAAVWPWPGGEREVYVRIVPREITGRRIELRTAP